MNSHRFTTTKNPNQNVTLKKNFRNLLIVSRVQTVRVSVAVHVGEHAIQHLHGEQSIRNGA